MPFIRTLGSGKSQIKKDVAFVTLLDGRLPAPNIRISELFKQFDARIVERDSSVKGGALSNIHGDWYEWLLAIQAWNDFILYPETNLAILLPNISQFDVARLYSSDLYELIEDLRAKVQETSRVQLITSNPDFVIIDKILAKQLLPVLQPIEDISIESLSYLENIYKNFVYCCNFEQIVGYISVKTSFRPDRRLQISHEGSLMKAIYTHLQTRKWIINPKGLKYFAMATSVGNQDREGLRTVATHSITTVSSLPQAAVDGVYEINTLSQAQIAFADILHT